MPTNLRAAAMSVAELLSYCTRFEVPDYQRVYGWKEVQLQRLFADLGAAMSAPLGGVAAGFFLGTIYLSAPAEGGVAQIADGQQRLMTVTMVYAAARDLAEDPAEADALHALMTVPDDPSTFRFAPRPLDAAFFAQWVQERGATLRQIPDGADPELSESQQNIVNNRNAIVSALRHLGPAGRRALLDFHRAAIDVVVISAPTLEAARNAYASTQSRGLRQSETDKLKVELLGDCNEDMRGRLAGHWEGCEALFGRDDFAELFHHMIFIESERRPQHALEVDLFAAFALPRRIEGFVEGVLVPSAQAYQRFCAATMAVARKQRGVNGHLIALQRTTHETWKAPALLALRELGNDGTALEAFLRDLERLAAVMMIIGTDPNKMIERYVAVIRDIKRGAISASTALRPDAAELARAREYLVDTRFALRERFRMPVLLKLNDLCAGAVQAVDPKIVSCEHVLPRSTPRRGPWREHFLAPDGRYDGGSHTHALGNLALLTHQDNRLADAQPYDVKRPILRRSAYALSNEAAKTRNWTRDAIRARTERLVALLVRYWRLDEMR